MIIYKYEVPNELILQYCRIIKMGEKGYNSAIMSARSEVHNEIFNYVGCCRNGVTRDDRQFIIALNNTIADLTYKED